MGCVLRVLFVFGGLALLMTTATILFLIVKIPYMRAQRLKQMKADYQKLQWVVGRQQETIQALEDHARDNQDIDRPLANLLLSEIESHHTRLKNADMNIKELLR